MANKDRVLTKEEVLRKVKGLLLKAEPGRGATDGEIDNCNNLIHKLLTEHNLSLMDLGEEGEAEIRGDVTHTIISMGVSYPQNFAWCVSLASAVAKLCYCNDIRYARSRQWAFIGAAADVETACELYNWIVGQMKERARVYLIQQRVKKATPLGNKLYNQFMLGCANRLWHRMAALKTVETTALVRMADVIKERNDRYGQNALNVRVSNRLQPKTKANTSAAAMGARAADSIQIIKTPAALGYDS